MYHLLHCARLCALINDLTQVVRFRRHDHRRLRHVTGAAVRHASARHVPAPFYASLGTCLH